MTSQVDEQPPPYRLSAKQRYGSLTLLLLLFFFGGASPIWNTPFDVDWQVWLSYIPIPFVVLGLLLYSRRFSGVAMFLNTLELTLVKFAITYTFAIGMWALSDGPPERPGWQPSMKLAATVPASPGPEQAPSTTPWPDDRVASVAGRVLNVEGEPVAHALVYVAAGLEAVQATVPDDKASVAVERTSKGALFVAREYQAIEARAADGAMHNLVASLDGRVLFNVPLLADGAPQQLSPPPAQQLVSLRCMVHAQSEGWHAQLLVLDSPHFAWTDADGRFELTKVPALPIQLAALHPRLGRATSALQLRDGAKTTTELQLAPVASD